VEFISNVYSVDGQKVIQCFIRDITQQKQAEDKLALSEIRYRSLFESAKDGILVLDAETGKIEEINPFLVDMLGFKEEKLSEKAVWEVNFFKDIVTNKDKFMEMQQKQSEHFEDVPMETADGRKINIEFISKVFSVENHKVIQCFIRDISKIKDENK
jgi:two-component system CheB/CheR fusion protein